MMQNDAALHEVAAAIAAGDAIDWAAVESSAIDESLRQILSDLRVIATIAGVHQSAPLRPVDVTDLDSSAREAHDSWGPLRLLEKVGAGSSGEVYRAWDPRLDREVALKLLPARSTLAAGPVPSIIQEGRLLARIRHPNVVTIHGAEQIEDRIGLWMEFIRGRTLEDVLSRQGPFSPVETIRIGVELCRAVAAVHSAGLLHRDIKTHNVMLADDNGRVVLMDFGSSRELRADASQGLAGTPLYFAPERLRGGDATPASDIYAVGVLLHRVLTGSYPISARTLDELRAAHEHGERPNVRARRPDVPSPLARVIERALDPDVHKRYQRADAVGSDLAALLPPRTAVRALYFAAAAAAVLLLGAGWQLLGSLNGSTRTPAALAARIAGWAPVNAPAATSVHQPVIAVLPFENLNPDPETDYFADGLTDEVIGQLAPIEGLQVRSRTSSFTFKGKSRNLRDIGQQLGVNHVVEGSVLRAGTKVRINVKLVTVADDALLWSEKFDTDLKDVFAVLDEIPRAIVNRLRLKLGNRQRRYDTNVAAYDLYLRARALVDRRGGRNLENAVKLFEQALANDPAFAPAHAGLANAYALMAAPLSSTFPFEQARSKIRQSAERALEIDSLLADAHVAMGWLYAFESEWENSEQAFELAIKHAPSLTQAYTGYSISTLQPQAKLDEALAILRLARERDPLSLDVEREIGTVQLLMGHYAEAVATLRRVRDQRPDFPFVDLFLARALLFAGNVTDAVEILERLEGQHLGEFKGPNVKRGAWLALPYVMLGRRAEAETLIAEHTGSGSPATLAVVYAALGDKPRALDALERLSATMPHHLGRTLLLPELAGLQNEPRFAALRKQLNLPAR